MDARRLLQIIADGGHCRKTFGIAFICANLEAVFPFKHALNYIIWEYPAFQIWFLGVRYFSVFELWNMV